MHVEGDHRIGLVDRGDLPLIFGAAQLSAVMSVAYFTTLTGRPARSRIGL
jgi:hypothetical protein